MQLEPPRARAARPVPQPHCCPRWQALPRAKPPRWQPPSYDDFRGLHLNSPPLRPARTTQALRPTPENLRLAMTISTISSLPPTFTHWNIHNRFGEINSEKYAPRVFGRASLLCAFDHSQAPPPGAPRKQPPKYRVSIVQLPASANPILWRPDRNFRCAPASL